MKYDLADQYLSFYYAFIKPAFDKIQNGPALSFSNLAQQGFYHNWDGRAFKKVCTQCAHKIAHILGFSGISYKTGPFFRAGRRNTPGIQIDLLFDRDDNVLTLCEMKSSVGTIGIGVLSEVERKREILQKIYPRYTIQPVLIYNGKLSRSLEASPYIFRKIDAADLIES